MTKACRYRVVGSRLFVCEVNGVWSVLERLGMFRAVQNVYCVGSSWCDTCVVHGVLEVIVVLCPEPGAGQGARKEGRSEELL